MTKSTLLFGPALCMSFLLAGCPDDSSEPTTTNADTSTGNDEDTSPDSSASVTIGTTMTSDDTTADTTNMTTTMSTTDSTDTTSPETTDNPTETTENPESSSSSSAETTATDSSSSGAMESSSSSGAMETGMGGDGYGDCADNHPSTVCLETEVCLYAGNDAICSPADCTTDDDCPAAATGDATPTCVDIGGAVNFCLPGCAGGETCPDGTTCNDQFGVCLWVYEGADAPDGWNCPAAYYGSGDGCDCGCGIVDTDCTDETAASCEFCDDINGCSVLACPSNIDAADNSTCSVPAEWTCSEMFYAAGDGCDCGCGVIDLDCADATVDSCDYCDDEGSCSAEACPGSIDMTDNSTCS